MSWWQVQHPDPAELGPLLRGPLRLLRPAQGQQPPGGGQGRGRGQNQVCSHWSIDVNTGLSLVTILNTDLLLASHAAMRNMMACTVTGQGAGTAAAVSIKVRCVIS